MTQKWSQGAKNETEYLPFYYGKLSFCSLSFIRVKELNPAMDDLEFLKFL